jgi:hypothetical protein
MSRPADVSVTCPVCRFGTVDCWVDPGEPMVTSGPSDNWYPGSPAGLDEFEADCECWNSILVDGAKYREALEERALNDHAENNQYERADRWEEF